jgi:hypothetical protein
MRLAGEVTQIGFGASGVGDFLQLQLKRVFGLSARRKEPADIRGLVSGQCNREQE